MVIHIGVVFFAIFICACSATDLETKCNASSRPHVYSSGSCYIAHTEKKMYYTAKLSCNDILGYSGHLIHIRSSQIETLTVNLLAAAGSLTDSWMGSEFPTGTPTVGSSPGWYYTTLTRKFEEPTTYIPWNPNNPIYGKVMNYQPSWRASAALSTWTYTFICEYEEKYAYPVTKAATYCNSNASNTMFAYIDGSCFTLPHDPYVQANSVATYRNSCPQVAGLVSRVAHLNTTGKLNIAHTFGRATCERLGKSAADVDNCYQWVIGMEQLKACSANSCSEEGGYSWFWTTPEGYKWPANTQISGFWANGYPIDNSSEFNYGTYWGYSGKIGVVDMGTSFLNYTIMCEYLEPYNFTNFEQACLLSPNPSAPGYSSCFTLNRAATTFASAQSGCTEFANGYLAQIDTVEMATFISTALWAKVGLPPSQPLFTGLQQFPSSIADEPDKKWYWMYPDGTKTLASASSLPWSPGQPLSAGDCASITQSGLLITTNCTANQWYICQYSIMPLTTTSTTTTTTAGGIGTTVATPTNTAGTISKFYHYSFGYFTNSSYWLSESAVPLFKCQYMCHLNELCFGYTYNSGTSNCQLLAINASESLHSSELTVDPQCDTVTRHRQ